MTVHRFFIPKEAFTEERVILPEDISKQVTKVLRIKTGESIVVLDNLGNEYEVLLDAVTPQVSGKIISQKENQNEPKVKIVLYQAMLPRDKFEVVLQKGTEVGVSEFVPLETKRTLLKQKDFRVDKTERLKRIIKEAAEQSERGLLPALSEVLSFEQAIKKATQEGDVLIAWEREENSHVSEVLTHLSASTISLFIGPEGGFEESEITFAREHGAKTVGVGKRILRSETAGPVITALVLYAKGDLD